MSELSMYLGQVFGLYLIIAGVIIMARQRYLVPVISMIAEEKFDRFVLAILEVLGGLFFVLGFSDWGSFYTGLITLIGWLFLAEGVMYLVLSDKAVEKLVAWFNVKAWYLFGGLASIGFGVYLAGTGFGML